MSDIKDVMYGVINLTADNLRVLSEYAKDEYSLRYPIKFAECITALQDLQRDMEEDSNYDTTWEEFASTETDCVEM
jgi:hypothetical protein